MKDFRKSFEEEYTGESAQDRQIGGSHYKDMTITPRDYIKANKLGWDESNVIKYVSRYRNKNKMQDLEKALHYLEMLIEDYRMELEQEEQVDGF
jgi:hypothetical protein